jgi:hypothetical protein
MSATVKLLLTGIAGGVAMFFWGYVAHGLSPLGTAGMHYLGAAEDEIMNLLREHAREPGIYPFPFFNTTLSGKAAEDAMKVADEKHRRGPHGLIIVDPIGREMLTPGMLVTEFVTNVVTSLLAAVLLSQATGLTSFGSRVAFVATIGLVAGIAVNIPHWNWYSFPLTFTLAEILEHFVGFTLVGVVAALIMPKGTLVPATRESGVSS